MTNEKIIAAYESETAWVELVESWVRTVEQETDFGYIEPELTNSIYAEKCYEWAHYGYSRREHREIVRHWVLDDDNACLIKYKVRQYDLADGPSADIHQLVGAGLANRGYRFLGTTSNDEWGTYLTYWYLREFCSPKPNPSAHDDGEDDEPYNRWDDPYDD